MSIRELSGYETSKEFYDLFFKRESKLTIREYLENSYCDDIALLNLKEDTYKMKYHVGGKYFTPVTDGKYSSLFDFTSESVIHPDDKELYLKMMSPDKVLDNLHNSETPNFFFFHFRCRLRDGSWRWVEEAVLTGEENGFKEGEIGIYVFDIHNTIIRKRGEVADDANMFSNDIDDVTGLPIAKSFENKAIVFFQQKNYSNYCVISIDIEHFKLFDEWYGRENGDYLLAKIGRDINEYIEKHGGIAGYFGQDDFSLLVIYDQKAISELYDKIKCSIAAFGITTGFNCAMGICLLKDATNISDALDKASVAEFRAKHENKNRIQIYDIASHNKEEEDYHVMLNFMDALKNDEITFYLQPQCRISTGRIVGAEALARWVKKDGTIIPPGVFVPVLEKYGFITDLDKHIWEKVCQMIAAWLEKGNTPLPISLNVSRIDIYNLDIPAYFDALVKKYNIPPSLIKIEITESAYVDTTVAVGDLVNKLRDLGFLILMDDFGSGYSSLNMLSSLKVDAIKLDALFLNIEKNENYSKAIHILESVVNMAKQIALPVIVEGVETQQQKEFLEELGCRYVQGYFFYKPMPIGDFEKLILDENNVDLRGFVVKANEQFKVREFMDENIYSDTMLNSILGPVAFYSWNGKVVDIVRYNQQFYETVNVPDFMTRLNNIEQYMPEDDIPIIHKALDEAKRNKLTGSQAVLHFYKTDGTLTTYVMRYYYLGEKEGTSRYYGSANNVSALADLEEKFRLITNYASSTIIFMRRRDNDWKFEVVAHGLEAATGFTKEGFEARLNDKTLYKQLDKKTAEHMKEILNKCFSEKKHFALRYDFINAKKNKIKIELVADPVLGKTGNVEFLISMRLAQ